MPLSIQKHSVSDVTVLILDKFMPIFVVNMTEGQYRFFRCEYGDVFRLFSNNFNDCRVLNAEYGST